MKTQSTMTRRNLIKGAAVAAAAGAVAVPAAAHADSVTDAIGKLFGGGDSSETTETTDTTGTTGTTGTPAGGSVDYSVLFEDALNANGLKYSRKSETRINIGFVGDNFDDIDISVFFDEDGDPYVHMFCWSMGNAGQGDYASALAACNTMNDRFYWAKFYIDSDQDIAVEVDAIVDAQTCGAETHELLMRMANIIDDAYPDISAALSGAAVSA